MRVLVIGGTLFIGRLLVEALLAAGHRVSVLHRNAKAVLPPGVNGLLADRNDGEAVQEAVARQRFEAVFDNVYDWQRGTTAEQVAATARACATDALEHYVFTSSVAAFGTGLDHLDSDPLAPPDAPDAYARNKANSERALFEMHARTGFPASTVRPPFIYGPGNPFYREAFFWDRLRDRRPILVPEDGSERMQFVYVHDLVKLYVGLLGKTSAKGLAFNTGEYPPVTQLEAVRAFARALDAEADVRFLPRRKALEAGGHPMGPKMYFAEYYDLPAITMRTPNAERILGLHWTAFDQGLRETAQWWRGNSRFPAPDYSFEDELLRAI